MYGTLVLLTTSQIIVKDVNFKKNIEKNIFNENCIDWNNSHAVSFSFTVSVCYV